MKIKMYVKIVEARARVYCCLLPSMWGLIRELVRGLYARAYEKGEREYLGASSLKRYIYVLYPRKEDPRTM